MKIFHCTLYLITLSLFSNNEKEIDFLSVFLKCKIADELLLRLFSQGYDSASYKSTACLTKIRFCCEPNSLFTTLKFRSKNLSLFLFTTKANLKEMVSTFHIHSHNLVNIFYNFAKWIHSNEDFSAIITFKKY